MTFYSGQKVVCINNAPRYGVQSPLRIGEVYTVLRLNDCGCAGCAKHPGVWLVELEPPMWCCSFYHKRFRPAVDRKTDISAFKVKELEEC